MQVWSARRNDLATCFLFNSPKDLPQEGEGGTGLRPAAVFLPDTFFAFSPDQEIDSFCITYSYFLGAGETWCHIFIYSTWFFHQQCTPLCPDFFSIVNYLYIVSNTCSLNFLYFTRLLYLMWCSQNYYINSVRICKCEDGFFFILYLKQPIKFLVTIFQVLAAVE